MRRCCISMRTPSSFCQPVPSSGYSSRSGGYSCPGSGATYSPSLVHSWSLLNREDYFNDDIEDNCLPSSTEPAFPASTRRYGRWTNQILGPSNSAAVKSQLIARKWAPEFGHLRGVHYAGIYVSAQTILHRYAVSYSFGHHIPIYDGCFRDVCLY